MSTHQPRFSGGRLWAMRFALLAVSSFLGVLIADRIVGIVAQTSQRHRLRLAPNLSYRHRSTEFDYFFRTNSRGFRGPEVPVARSPETYRIAVLGDSFVAGYGVADEDLITAQLAEDLVGDVAKSSKNPTGPKRVQVINLGRVGSSTIRELEVYEKVGRTYRPDVVVLMFFAGNDLREIVEERDPEEIRRWHPQGFVRRVAYSLFPNLYLELAIWKQHGEIQRRLAPRSQQELLDVVDRMARQYGADPQLARERYLNLPAKARTALEQSLADDWRILPPCFDPGRLKRGINPDDPYFKTAWPRVEHHLDLLRRAVEADGGKLVVCVIPDAAQVDEDAYRFDESLGYDVEPQWLRGLGRTQRALQDWAENADVPCLDLTDSFRRSAEPLYFPKDGHFNPAGHAKAAELLAQFLAAQGLTPIPEPAEPSQP